MLRGRGGCEEHNVDGGLPKGTECGKVHVVGWVITTRDPVLVLLRKEASSIDDANADVSKMSLSRMGCLARLVNVAPRNRRPTMSLNPCEGCYSKAMAVQLASRSSADVRPYFAAI
jgi:hypothetical protein